MLMSRIVSRVEVPVMNVISPWDIQCGTRDGLVIMSMTVLIHDPTLGLMNVTTISGGYRWPSDI